MNDLGPVAQQVDIATTAPKGVDPDFKPTFSQYDVLISNYNGAPWPEETQEAFVSYMKNGGGLVVIHAANNAFEIGPSTTRLLVWVAGAAARRSPGPMCLSMTMAR